MPLFALCDEVRQVEVSVGAGNEINFVVAQQLFAHALRHAAYDTDHASLAVLAARQFLQAVLNALLGIITNGAGVKKNDVRLVDVVGVIGIGGAQDSRYHLAVSHVHLAAVGLYIK